MDALKCIIVGFDYSECSKNALREAARLASWHHAKLICLHVFEEEIIDDFRDHYKFDRDQVMKDAHTHLSTSVTGIVGDQEVENRVVIGYPFKVILDEVAKNKADLLVMGSRGHRQHDVRKTGVFAAKCIRKAPLPVLLVREQQDGPFQSIVVCVDFSDTSKLAAQRAVEIARQDGSSLEFFHAFATPFMPDGSSLGMNMFMTPIDTEPMRTAAKNQLQGWADELAGDQAEKLEITVTVNEGISPSNVLIDHLHESNADLAVLGTRGRTGIRSMLLGTTAERLIQEAPCSTLAIKPEGFTYELH